MEEREEAGVASSPPSEHGHQTTARERQRRGPMWGCLKTLLVIFGGASLLLLLVVGSGWWYVGTSSFADLVRLRIEKTLEARLGRDVTIKRFELDRRGRQVVLHDVRIANAPGATTRYFATVEKVVITGGIESFWSRRVRVGRIDVISPRLWFEIFPEGSQLTHSFPRWRSGPRSKYEIVRLDLGRLYVRQGEFTFLDRRRDLAAEAIGIESSVQITRSENVYAGILRSPRLRVRLQEHVPFDLDMRGGFRYTPGVLALNSIALRGPGMQLFLSGKLDPLTEAAYDFRLTGTTALDRVQQIFRVERPLSGDVSLDTRLTGKQGDFSLAGRWIAPQIVADTWELGEARGNLSVTGRGAVVDIESATYGGGTVSGRYALAQYGEPYPMDVDLRYNAISIEQLFSDFGIDDTGLRAAATGNLSYRWNKDRLLEGSGEGSARLARNAVAFSQAKYPVPVAGSTDFALDGGVIRFRRTELDTPASHVSLAGSMRIENAAADWAVTIRSRDFSELDKIAYNFAHSAGKNDFELLGLGGAGTIAGTVRGPLKTPQIAARISSTDTRYNDVLLGSADIDLRYDGPRSVLSFDRALFSLDGGRLALTGTVAFPERGPSPRFDIAVDATGYPIERALQAVNLDFAVGPGSGSGRLVVTGTPQSGTVRFAGLTIRRDDAELRLAGDITWSPGEGNVRFDLDIAATNFPVSDIIAFLDLGTFPVTGKLTGTLRLAGPKQELEGAGSITVREGTIYGEPVDLASADIVFTQGRMRATNVVARGPAGEVAGEAEFNLVTQKFNYSITASRIDIARIGALRGLAGLFGGRVTLRSTGAGTTEDPEIVVEATLDDATIRGLALPPGAAPPTIYLAVRDGQLIVRGSIADVLTVEGSGTVAPDMTVNGLVRVVVTDIARLVALSPTTATLPASGNLTIDLALGGKLSSLEALRIDGTVPTLNLVISDHEFTAPQPLRFALRDGRIVFEQFRLLRGESAVDVTGFAEITGAQQVDVDISGAIEAALLQLFLPDVRADGSVAASISIEGTLTRPVIAGTAELQDAQVRFAGFPQLIDEINGTLRFSRDRVDIEALSATVGGGRVVAGGFVLLDGFRPVRFQVPIQGDDVTLRYFEGLTLAGNFRLVLSGDAERALIQGDVDVTRALYFRDFDLQQAILNVILTRRGIAPVVSASWQEQVALRLTITADDGTLAVRNNVANLTGNAELDVAGTLANPVVLGTVDLDEGGTFTFQNVDYRLTRGSIAFQNPFRIDPFFDVTLEGRVSGGVSELESGPIDITVNLTGTLDRITPTITSDPPASDITLFSLLGLGGLTRQGDGNTASASMVGQSLLVQSLSSALGSRILPFADSFTFDPGLIDTGSGADPKVTFEKRLSNTVRLLVVYNLTSHDSREVVEWNAGRDWTLQLTRDEQKNEYRVDARFRRRYDGRWSWGGRGVEDEIFPVASVADAVGGPQVAIAPPLPTTAVTSVPAGMNVAQVQFRSDAGFDTSTLTRYVTIQPGQPLSRRDVQTSIKSLFATGNFRDVRVDAAPSDAGATVTFSLFLNYRIGDIDIEGLDGRERRRAQNELTVRTGEVLSLNDVDDSAVAVEEQLRIAGYLEATVDPETAFLRDRNVATVTFHVTAGPRATVASVEIEGETSPFVREQVVRSMRQRPGKAFNLAEARRDAERIHDFFVERDYRRADVDFLGHTYDDDANTVALRYRAQAGPLVRVEVQGVERRAVRRLLPFRDDDEPYSEDVIDEAATRIVRSYQQRGWYNAAVDTEARLEGNTWITTFIVQPGQRYRLEDVTFSGNIKLPDDELEDVVETSPGGGFRGFLARLFRRPTGITREQLSNDRDALEAWYRLRGFSTAVVETPVVRTRPDGSMIIDFPIVEGPQTIVTAVRVEGAEQVTADELPTLQVREGEPLNPQSAHEDIVALQTFYGTRGNAEVQISPRVEISEDRTSAQVVYTVSEGPQVQVGEIIVRGNTYTDDDVILRKSQLDEGEPFSYTSMLEAQQSLYRLGIFNRVDVQPEQSGTSPGERSVVVAIEEGRNLTATGSVGLRFERGGADGERDLSLRLAGALSHRNLFGTGRYLGLEAVTAGEEEQDFFLTYREPFIGRYDVPVQLNIFQTDDATVTERRILQRGTSIEASRVAQLGTRWSLQYQYKISQCTEGRVCDLVSEDIFVPGLDRSLLDTEISSFTPTFFWDRRDDIFDPHRGFFTSASVEFAFPAFSADASFTKEFVQGAWYIPVSTRSVFALSGRIGFIQPRGRANGSDDAARFVPLSERFTAGGDTSHRAYPLDLLGTLCEGDELGEGENCRPTLYRLCQVPGQCGPEEQERIVPLGGNSMAVFNAEYRFPIFSSLGGAVFADIGNVFARSTIDFSDLRLGIGGGIRYLSPVGPIRIDIGWPMNRRPYERPFAYSVTLGYAF